MSRWFPWALIITTFADCHMTLVRYERRYVFVSYPLIPLPVVPRFTFFVTFSSATYKYFHTSRFSSRPLDKAGRRMPIARGEAKTAFGQVLWLTLRRGKSIVRAFSGVLGLGGNQEIFRTIIVVGV